MSKVCILTSVHPSFDTRIFHKEAKSLVKASYDVMLIAQHDKNEVVDGVKIVALPKPKNRLHRMLTLPSKAFRLALKQKADIYHFHDPELLTIGILLKIFTRKKVIYDVHEDYAKQTLSKPYIPKIARKVVALLINLIEYISSKFFDGIVTATDDILKNFSYHKKAVSIKNFPILTNFSDKRKNNSNPDILNLIYIGGLSKIRGITEMVRALELINPDKKVKLILYGKFDSTDYEIEVRKLKGFEKVEYLGWIGPKKIPGLLIGADMGMVCFLPKPNHINSMPNKLFEYMAAGIPVVASKFPLWKEIVEGNNCGICVDPTNPKEIADAIQWLIEHSEEAWQMGENGRKAVSERYNWENEGKKLLDLYERLLQS